MRSYHFQFSPLEGAPTLPQLLTFAHFFASVALCWPFQLSHDDFRSQVICLFTLATLIRSLGSTMFDLLKGGTASQLEKDIGSDQFPANEHYFGLVNVSDVTLSDR